MTNHDDLDAPEQLLTPSEVAAMFRVNPKTVTRWARAGKLTAIRTLGGHRRFRVSEIRRCLEEMSVERGATRLPPAIAPPVSEHLFATRRRGGAPFLFRGLPPGLLRSRRGHPHRSVLDPSDRPHGQHPRGSGSPGHRNR